MFGHDESLRVDLLPINFWSHIRMKNKTTFHEIYQLIIQKILSNMPENDLRKAKISGVY